MLLPSRTPSMSRLVRMPPDLAPAEAYRLVTGLIAELEQDGDVDVEEVVDLLEEHGFEGVELILGPPLD